MRQDTNSSIAKNTVLLYVRTLIVMIITLYVSRLILKALGVVDYGIYNAVGGIVGMFALLSSSLIAATQRYITFEMGKKNQDVSHVFSVAMGLHLILSLALLIIGEIAGVYFLNVHMNIPPDRLYAANWVFQFSVISFIIQLVTIPYNALIIANEKMGYYAIISVVEAVLKLIFAILLLLDYRDSLILYSISMAIISLGTFLMNALYCSHNYRYESKFKIVREKEYYVNMGSFIGWNFFGSSSTVLSKQGVSLLINVFFGVILNAGRGIAIQVDNAVYQFMGSFTTAIRPQITKKYAAGEYDSCFELVNKCTKIVLVLTLFFVLPLFFRCEQILILWLGNIPDYAVIFTKLSLIIVMFDSLSYPLYFLMLATGKIKGYQLSAGVLGLLTFPLTWFAFICGFVPEVTYYILIMIDIARWLLQLCFLYKIAKFPVLKYLRKSILPCFTVIVLAIISCTIMNLFIDKTLFDLILYVALSCIILALLTYAFALDKIEKENLLQTVINRIHHVL